MHKYQFRFASLFAAGKVVAKRDLSTAKREKETETVFACTVVLVPRRDYLSSAYFTKLLFSIPDRMLY